MEGGSLLHLENKGNVRGERNQKLSLMESMVKGRRGLADITNTVNQLQKPARPTLMDQKIPSTAPLSSDKECIAQLLKENTALLRLLGERNKIIELNDLELQRLRVSVQQLQQQNWQLAKANSQMLEELNSGKDRLKAIQHQLGCTVAALNSTKLELEMKKNLKKELCNNEFIIKEQTSIQCEEAADEPLHQDEEKACFPSRKRTSRSHSLGSATVTHEAASKDNNRRKSLWRGSSNLKSQTCEPKENLKKELCNNEFIIKEQTSIQCEEAADDPLHQDEEKACFPSRKRTSRSHSLGLATVTHEAASKDNNRRKSLRRGSSNLKSQTCEPKEDLFEIEDIKFPVSSLLTDSITGNHMVQQDLSVSYSSNSCSTLKVKKEGDMDAGDSPGYQTQDLHQSSSERPSRRATIGVSYKEPPLNTKMRRH